MRDGVRSRGITDEINQDLDAAYAAAIADRAWVSVQVPTQKTGGAITADLPEPTIRRTR